MLRKLINWVGSLFKAEISECTDSISWIETPHKGGSLTFHDRQMMYKYINEMLFEITAEEMAAMFSIKFMSMVQFEINETFRSYKLTLEDHGTYTGVLTKETRSILDDIIINGIYVLNSGLPLEYEVNGPDGKLKCNATILADGNYHFTAGPVYLTVIKNAIVTDIPLR